MNPLISVKELEGMFLAERPVLFDVREREDFARGHIPWAVNVDAFSFLAKSSPQGEAEFAEHFAGVFGRAGWDGSRRAVFIEESMESGLGRSCRGYVFARALGCANVSVLHGGFAAWRAAGKPVSTAAQTPIARTLPVSSPDRGVLVAWEQVRDAVSSGGAVIVDTRDAVEWIGESSSPYGKDFCPRKGRIPGARWLEWRRVLKPTPKGARFKSRAELLADCATLGLTPDAPVILYCFKGARAAAVFVALEEAGFTNVRLYLASWNEWSRNEDLPIETGNPADVLAAA
jgi:thiosulfate/3-mercaptopyruvate sulfurtransferase